MAANVRAFVLGPVYSPVEPYVDPVTSVQSLFLSLDVCYYCIEPYESRMEVVRAQILPADLPLVMKTKVTDAVKARALAFDGAVLANTDVIFPDFSRGA